MSKVSFDSPLASVLKLIYTFFFLEYKKKIIYFNLKIFKVTSKCLGWRIIRNNSWKINLKIRRLCKRLIKG